MAKKCARGFNPTLLATGGPFGKLGYWVRVKTGISQGEQYMRLSRAMGMDRRRSKGIFDCSTTHPNSAETLRHVELAITPVASESKETKPPQREGKEDRSLLMVKKGTIYR